jgi:hypothetical protein
MRKIGGKPTLRWTSDAPSLRAACKTLSKMSFMEENLS